MVDIFDKSLAGDLFSPIPPETAANGAEISPYFQQRLDEQATELSAAASWAKKFDPQSYAEAAKLAPGIPPEVGIRQMELLRDTERMSKYEEVFARAPSLQSYFVERPKDLAYTHPDELDNLSGISWAAEAFPDAVAQGWAQTQGGQAGWAMIAGTATAEQQELFANYREAEWRNFGARDGWWANSLVNLGQMAAPLGQAVAGALSKGSQFGVAGGAGGLLVGGPAGAAAGAGMGFRVGAPLGFFEENYQTMAGQAYAEFLDFKDENGQALDDTTAKWAALLTGLGSAGLEQIGAIFSVGKIPGMENLTGSLTIPGMKALLSNPTYRGAFTRFAKNLGEAVTIETLTEMSQEGLQVLGGELAKDASGQDFANISPSETATRVWDAGVGALQVMTLMGPFVAGTRLGADIRQIRKSMRENEQLQGILQTLAENPLVERAPQVAADLVDKQTNGKELFIDAAQAVQLYQEQGLDLYATPIPNWRSRVEEALKIGGDVKLTVGEFAAYLSRDPKENPLAALVRTDPEGYAESELADAREVQQMIFSSELGKAQTRVAEAPEARAKAAPLETFPELELLRKQITSIGFAPQAVEHFTTVMGSIYNTLANKLGKSPSELFKEHGLQIVRDALTNGSDISTNLDPNTLFQNGLVAGEPETVSSQFETVEEMLASPWEPETEFESLVDLETGIESATLPVPNTYTLNGKSFPKPTDSKLMLKTAEEIAQAIHLMVPNAPKAAINAVESAVFNIFAGNGLIETRLELADQLEFFEHGDAVMKIFSSKLDFTNFANTTTPLPEGWTEIVEEELSEVATPKNWRNANFGDAIQGDKPWLAYMPGPQEYGEHIARITQTPQFLNWFQDSEIRDSEGKPLIVYHGAKHTEDFPQFRNSLRGASFFATNPKFASGYGSSIDDGRMIPVFLKVQNPAGQTLDVVNDIVHQFGGFGVDAREIINHWRKLPDHLRKAHFEKVFGFERYHNDVSQAVYRLLDEFADGILKEQGYFESWGLVEPINKLLEESGYDGYYEMEGGSINIGVFEPQRQVKSIFNRGTFDPTQEDMLHQPKKGAITFQDTQSVIRLFDGHDMSTLLHETGHFYLNVLRKFSKQSPELASDWEIVRKHLGIGDNGQITREQHEKFARAAEAYFMEGKAPTPELAGAFRSFARWLKTLYQKFSAIGGKVSPEIRGVFDRMLATDARLAELEADNAYRPLFDSAESMGLTLEEYVKYQQLVEELKNDAQEGITERIGNQVRRQTTGWRKQIYNELRKEAEDKLSGERVYKLLAKLRSGEITIDVKALKDRDLSDAAIKKFPSKGVRVQGLDPQILAELSGYATADDLIYDIVKAEPIKEAAKLLAQQEMARRYEVDFEQSAMVDLAIKQQLNAEGRLTILATELKALNKKNGRDTGTAGPMTLARSLAKDSIYRKKVKEVSERQTNAAIRRAGTMADNALIKGDWATAADWKRKQLLAQAIAIETTIVGKTIQKIRDKGARYSRKASPSVDPSFMEQIQSIVEKYEFTKVSNKKLNRRADLRAFLEEQEADGLVTLPIPERLLRDAGKINYKELTVEDLLDIGDTIDNLEHLGKVKKKLRTAQGQREFQAVLGEFKAQLKPLKRSGTRLREASEHRGTALHMMTAFMTGTLKPERIMEWLDAGDINGAFSKYIFGQIAEAETARNDLNAKYNEKLMNVLSDIPAKAMLEIFHIPSIGENLTREQIYAIALNTGNLSNKTKLLEGELWTEAQLADVVSKLDGKDWERIQKIWDVLDSLWPKIEALEKRLTGWSPPKIEALEIVNKHGTFVGGYYPVVYDFKSRRGMNLLEDTTPQDRQPGPDDIFQKSRHMTPGTTHKHTVKRTGVAKPIARELGVIPKHIHQVIHDLTHREAIRSAYKLLWHPDIKAEIIRIEGEHIYDQLQHWLRSVATEYAGETDPFQQTLARVRTGTTMVAMGYKATTAAAQVLGIFNVKKRVSGKYILGSAVQFAKHPKRTWDMVNELSGEMRHRFNQQDRDIRDTVKQLGQSKGPLTLIRAYAYYHIAFVDKVISSIAWTSSYQEFVDKNPTDLDGARRHADRTVRLTQGTGAMKDMAKVANANEYLKIFTMFYSAFSAIHNEIWDLTRQTKGDMLAGNYQQLLFKRMPDWFFVVMVPAILGPLITGQGPDEDEDPLWWAAKQVAIYPVVGVPLLRDVTSAAESGFDYRLSPISKPIEAIVKASDALWDGDAGKAIKPLATALATWYKLPFSQTWNTGEAIVKGLEYQDFEALDLYKGRQGR